MPKLSRRETLARGGQAVAAAAVLPFLPSVAAAKGDAELLRAESEHRRINDEINAGLHSPDGNVSDEASNREWGLVNTVADTPASGLEGVAVKLRMAMYEIGVSGNEDMPENRCVLSALETVERLAGRAI